jgi:dGTPase
MPSQPVAGDLAGYAVSEQVSRGRLHPEPRPKARGEYQRDRDRIIHSTAFRRLEYKTQVFVNHEGDLFRTRLTHSIEVAQIARTVARVLCLNDDLTEAIALAHDLGHTPFGHAGQDALNECLAGHGGFEHNLQSLRIVDKLEERYGAFDGLNLMFETRAGILKHCSPAKARELGDLAYRFTANLRPTLEAQICNLADEIAYNNHDVDDGLRSGLIGLDQLMEISLFARHVREALDEYPRLQGRRLIHETVRRMIDAQVTDLLAETRRRIEFHRVATLADVEQAPLLVGFTDGMQAENRELKHFLHAALYQHFQVARMTNKARRVVRELYEAFQGDCRLLPPAYQDCGEREGLPRAVADYIAGMTDRYAMKEHRRLFAVGEL